MKPRLAPFSQDGVFGVVCRRMANADAMLDSQDMVRILREETSRPGFRDWMGPSSVIRVMETSAVRDWDQHLQKLKIHYEGPSLKKGFNITLVD